MDPLKRTGSKMLSMFLEFSEFVVKDVHLVLFSMYYFKWYASQCSLVKWSHCHIMLPAHTHTLQKHNKLHHPSMLTETGRWTERIEG